MGQRLAAGSIKRGERLSLRLLPILGGLLLWEAVARLLDRPLFPSVTAVAQAIIGETLSGALPANLAITLLRVAAAFILSITLGGAIGYAMGRWRRLDLLLDSALTALLNLPALVLIVLLYVWFGLNEFSAIAAVALNKLPTTAVTIREGTRALDRDLSEMGQCFRLSPWRSFRFVVLPQLLPYIVVASRSGLALIWKIVLVVELLGRSSGVGFQIEVFFQLFDVAHILAYTIVLMAVIQLIEWCVFQPLETRARRWRL